MAQAGLNNQSKPNSIVDIIKTSLRTNIRQYTMFIALIVIGLIFTILTKGTFMTSRNLSNLLLQTATTAIMAVGMVLVIVAGHIDLSVGSLLGFTGAIAAFLQVKMGMGAVPTILITLAVGILAGLWQGYWIAYKQLPAFIVTLAGMFIFKAGMLYVTKGQTLAPMGDGFKAIGQSYLPRLFLKNAPFHDTTLILGLIAIAIYIYVEMKNRKSRINYGFDVMPLKLQILKMIAVSALIGAGFMIMILYMGIPYSIILVIALVLIYSFIASKTRFGRYVYAIGGNKEAAKLSGINIQKTNMMIFISMGLLAAVASIVFTARLNSASASAGQSMELDVIASAIIGGTSTLGGEGTVIGAIIGALVMSTLNNGMSLMNLEPTYQFLVRGLILLLAVWVDISSRKKAA